MHAYWCLKGTVLELVLSQPFYCLGELVTTASHPLGNYLIAVSLHDHSMWLVYNAWDPLYAVTEDDLEGATGWDSDDYCDDSAAIELERQKWFRPDYDSCWAKFPGLTTGRTLMAKLADNVHTWQFDHSAELRMDPVWTDNDVVPAFVCARLTTDGYIFRPHVNRRYGYLSEQ